MILVISSSSSSFTLTEEWEDGAVQTLCFHPGNNVGLAVAGVKFVMTGEGGRNGGVSFSVAAQEEEEEAEELGLAGGEVENGVVGIIVFFLSLGLRRRRRGCRGRGVEDEVAEAVAEGSRARSSTGRRPPYP